MSGHRVEIYRDSRGEWRWRRVHDNGNILSDSAEGYANYQDAYDMAALLNQGVEVILVEQDD